LAAALVGVFTGAETTVLTAALLLDLVATGAFAAAFAAGLAGVLAAAALAAALAVTAFFATGFALLGAGFTLLSFPDFAFTSCLLAGSACAWSLVAAVALRPFRGLSERVSSARECTGLPMGKPISCKSETNIRRPTLSTLSRYTKDCSMPCKKMSLGKSMPINTILLVRASPSAQAGPRSLPINWCTPWKITLRSVPFI